MARLYVVAASVHERSKGARSFHAVLSASHVGVAIRQAFARSKVTAGASVLALTARCANATEEREHERRQEERRAAVRARLSGVGGEQ